MNMMNVNAAPLSFSHALHASSSSDPSITQDNSIDGP